MHLHLFRLLILLMPFALLLPASKPAVAATPSFNCALASDEIEKLICSNEELSFLDQQLSITYKSALENSGKMKDGIVLLQRSWLSSRSHMCARGEKGPSEITDCIKNMYTTRNKHLIEYLNVVGKEVPNKEFQNRYRVQWAIDEAFHIIVSDPKNAERVFRLDDSPKAKLGLAMVIRLFASNKESRSGEVSELLKQIAAGEHFGFQLEGYDGTIDGLIDYIDAASDTAELPCQLFERYPSLVDTLSPRFYSSMDHILPTAHCTAPEYNAPQSVQEFLTYVYKYSGDAFDRCTGTMRFGYGRRALHDRVVMQVLPRKLLDRKDLPEIDDIPLQRWAYDSLWNWHSFQETKERFIKARADLAKYYRTRFSLSDDDALRAAHNGLWQDLYWTHDVQEQPNSLRIAIIDDNARPTLSEILSESPAEKLAAADEGDDDPPMLIAVEHPKTVATLISFKVDVNNPNAFGKSALMAAAQYDQLESVNLLLKAGALVNATTLHPDQVPQNDPYDANGVWSGCGFYSIEHGNRTALMYAAANASLPIIEALLKAGADKTIRDSKDKTAFDYLTGSGPVSANPRITGADREKAEELLAP